MRRLEQKLGRGPTPVPKRRVNAGGTSVNIGNPTRAERNKEMRQMANGMVYKRPAREDVLWSALGNSDDGRNWAMVMLDPCGDIDSCRGLPDTICASTATPTYRGEYEIAYNVQLFTTPPTAPTTFNVEIFQPPIPEIALCYRLYDVSTSQWSPVVVLRQPGFENPAVNGVNTQSGITLRTVGYMKHRIIGKGTTMELNASDLSNQGRVVSGQIEGVVEVNDGMVYYGPTSATDLFLGTSGARAHCVSVHAPESSSYLVSACPKAYQAEAKQGAYIVHRFEDPLKGYQFQKCGGDSSNVGSAKPLGEAGPVAYPTSFMIVTFGNNTNYDNTNLSSYSTNIPINGGSAFNVPTGSVAGDVTQAVGFQPHHIHPYVSDPVGVMTAITFFEGLNVASTNTAAGTNPTIRVKTRLYLECLSGGSPAIAPFITPSPMYDDKAITTVAMIGQLAADAYPACYNGFGDILGAIWNGLKKIGRPILKGLEYVPYVGTAAKYIGTGIDIAEGLESSVIPGGFAS